jgi:[CysO sulfur-carrier protein]-S-L-cysteine hydrolase
MKGPFRLVIPRPIYDAMLAHLRSVLPTEGCGLLAGTVSGEFGRVTMHLPLENVLKSTTEFESEPRGLFTAYKLMRAAGVDVLAVYHSHPTSAPQPSQRDRERNYSEQVVNLIISLREEEEEVRGWWISATKVQEAEFEVA